MKTTTTKKKTALFVLLCGLLVASVSGVAQADDIKVSYKVGDGTTITDGDNQIHIQGRTQARFTHSMLGAGVADTDSFAIPRGEFRVDGFTLNKKLKFGFEFGMKTSNAATTKTVCLAAGGTATANCPGGTTSVVSAESTSGLATLNDYYVDYVPNQYVGIEVGQFKVPFLKQQLTSSTKQQFVDRSNTTGLFDLGRDIGASVHGTILKKLNYAAFVMNGDGPNSFNRNNRALMAGTRLEVPLLGEYKPSESDVDYSQTPNLGVGFAYAFNERGSAVQASTIGANVKTHNVTADAGFKYKGLSIQTAGMLSHTAEGARLTNYGLNTQVGYFVIPKKLELAAKMGVAVLSKATANQYEYAGGVNYFIKGHGIKLQADYTYLKNSGSTFGRNDNIVRAAVNFIF